MAELIAAWLPFVVIMAFVVFFAVKQSKTYKRHVDEVRKINDEILEANRRMVMVLEEIKTVLQDGKNR